MLARGVQFGTDSAVWHKPEQFSSEINNLSGLIPYTAMTILVVDTTLYLVSIIFRIYFPSKTLSISEEALGAFGKSQTYMYEGFVIIIFEVNQAARDSDDTLICCVENMIEDRFMDSGASFHATYLQRRARKVQTTLRWTLKDVRYIPGLKRRLISVGQLDEEGYHVGFRDQQWKVTKGSLVVARGNKCGSLIGMSMLASKGKVPYVQKVDIYFCNVKEDKKTAENASGVAVDSVSTAYLIYRIPYVPIRLRILEEEWRGKDTSLTHLKVTAQMKYDTAFRIRRVTRLFEAKISHLWTRFMKPKNDSIVAEHGLSLEITQSPGGSLDISEGSKNSGGFKDSGRSDEEYSEDGASCKEGGSETPQVRRSTRESKAPI
ncbi:hypothetical protein Tco_0861344, partial [Tanacetum coccineum]